MGIPIKSNADCRAGTEQDKAETNETPEASFSGNVKPVGGHRISYGARKQLVQFGWD